MCFNEVDERNGIPTPNTSYRWSNGRMPKQPRFANINLDLLFNTLHGSTQLYKTSQNFAHANNTFFLEKLYNEL
jgi:hypothetical protein